MAQAKQDLQAIINAAAEKEGLDPELLQKIGGAESGFQAAAKNPKSTAKGLFQFVDKTWAEMGGKPGEQFIPQKNAELGARYVKRNMDMLTQTLGREPSYGEVYAAHFFGPTGAKALLTKADPNAPIEQSLAMFESPKRVQKVLKQNPNLKGKTTAEVLADLDAKMGGKKPVVQEAPTAAAPAKPSSGMFRRPVPRFIRSEAPNLGTGYNAALALMGLTDTAEDELTKAQETVAENEADNEVADFGQARKMLAEVQTPNAFANQQPRLMARGGAVRNAGSEEESPFKVVSQFSTLRPADTKWIADTTSTLNKYKTDAEAYNAAREKYLADVYNPYKTQVDAYNKAAEEYEKQPPSRFRAPFSLKPPTAPEAFSMAAPTDPGLTEEIIKQRVAAAQKAAAEDAGRRGTAINAVNRPRDFNLAGFGMAGINAPSMFRDGGEAKKSDKDDDAERFFENLVSAAKESPPLDLSFQSPPSQAVEGLGMTSAPPAVSGRIGTNFDALGGNVRIGAQGIAMQTPDKKILTMPGVYDIGYKTQVGPGNLDLSFQRQIQSMPGRGKDYAVNARYSYKFADGGEAKAEPEKGSAKAMLKEVGRSTQYLPADIAGSPVDLINLGLQGVDALTGSKLAQKMPVGGSEWLIDKANKYGLMDKPTGSLTETLTRIGTSVISPGAAVKSAAVAGGKAAGKTASVSRKALDEIYELSGNTQAKKAAATAAEETPVAPITAPKVAPAPVAEPAPKSQSRSMLDEIDPEIQKLINEPRAKGFEGPQRPKRTLTTPTPDRPFVSPLDKFFEKGDKPVTVEQLTNQLAKGSRDYEMSRVNQLLEGKSPKDKIRPSDLLRQLEETSPSRFRVEIKEPDPKNMSQFHATMENPFPSKPMGTVNLLEDTTPQEKLAESYLGDLNYKQLYRYKSSDVYTPLQEKDTAAKQLEAFFGSPMAKDIVGNDLTRSFKRDVPEIRRLSSKIAEIRGDMSDISYPSLASKYGYNYFDESYKLQQEVYKKHPEIKNIQDVGERVKKLSEIVDPMVKSKAERAILAGLDKKYGTNLLAHRESLGDDWDKLSGYEKSKITERMMGDLVGNDLTKSIKRFDELEKPYRGAVAKALSENEIYKGQHASIAKEKPISFSRFQDVTLPTKEDVMVIPELQSDRFQDILQKGTKGGSLSKDLEEVAQLEQNLDSLTRKAFNATDDSTRKQLQLEGTKIEQRMANLRERISEGTYNTPEFTPGIERMPQVMQQIMVKNAVNAGIQRGKNGVLFPGSDSSQAQLYEKLPNNIRAVLKDLGPGFEMRKVPLEYENGTTIERYGIFWKDDAAKRISTEGIRFKKGGMVDKNDADNQKYI
jgi:hypothetical protein